MSAAGKSENKPARRPVGRPSLYSPELAANICAQMAEGKSLRTICKADDMPDCSSVFLWLSKYPEFSQYYARAREQRAEAIFEESLEIADDSSSDWIETDGGPKLNQEHVQRAKLRVDTRKWFVSKLLPKVYGERTAVDHSGTVETIQHHVVDIAMLSPETRDALRQALLEQPEVIEGEVRPDGLGDGE